jgi:glutamate formiminotransferase
VTSAGLLVEAVPNFSEGRDPAAIAAIATALDGGGAKVLHVDSSPDAHRTVITLAGPLASVTAALRRGIAEAVARIDMRTHQGAHLRIGAVDVVPIVPLVPTAGAVEACVDAVRTLGEALATDLDLPIYLYEQSALRPAFAGLPRCRRHGYEALPQRWTDVSDQPDLGPRAWGSGPARTGAAVLGVRGVLVAMNFTLDSDDEQLARGIARAIRTAGPTDRPHRLAALRAVGWTMPGYGGRVQVSTNLLNVRVTSAWDAFQAVSKLGAGRGAKVVGAELIGLVPARVLVDAATAALGTPPPGWPEDEVLDAQAGADVAALGRGAGALRIGHLGGGMHTEDIQSRTLEGALSNAGLWMG